MCTNRFGEEFLTRIPAAEFVTSELEIDIRTMERQLL